MPQNNNQELLRFSIPLLIRRATFTDAHQFYQTLDYRITSYCLMKDLATQ